MTKRLILSATIATMILFTGCAKKSEPQNEPATQGEATQTSQSALLETMWLLTELNGAAIAVDSAKEPIYIQLAADGNQVNGSGGCNRISGSFAVDADTLIFGHMVATEMACPTGMDIEKALFESLEQSLTYTIKSDVLTMSSDVAVLARFRANK